MPWRTRLFGSFGGVDDDFDANWTRGSVRSFTSAGRSIGVTREEEACLRAGPKGGPVCERAVRLGDSSLSSRITPRVQQRESEESRIGVVRFKENGFGELPSVVVTEGSGRGGSCNPDKFRG